MTRNQRKLPVSEIIPVGRRNLGGLMVLSVCVLLSAGSVHAQGNPSDEGSPKSDWYATGYLQYSQGNYIFGSNTSTFYLVPGLRYESGSWSASAILPIVSQNNNFVTGAGGMLLPHGGSNMNMSSGTGGMMGGNGSSTMGGMSNLVGFGDLFLTGEYQIIHPDFDESTGGFGTDANSPTLGINVQIKVPTASTSNNFGTGKFDFGGSLNYRQLFGVYVIMANAGYLVLGRPAGVAFRNPFSYGGGVGRFFGNGSLSLALMYQGYTTILSGYPPPNQASVGLNCKTSSEMIWTVLLSKGLTETAPSFGITGGFRWSL